MARRSPARFIAPLALIAAVVAVVLVVQGNDLTGSGSKGSTSTQSDGDSTPTATSSTTATTERKKRKTYVVKPGDILTTVSERTGVTVEQLQAYNPGLDPQSLQVGQRIRLTPKPASSGATDTGTTTTETSTTDTTTTP
jgi:LysM repeat protein